MVTSGVVWCLKDNQLIPFQLNAIRLHGVLTQAHWAAVAEFLQRVANKQLILQDNGFTELTEEHKQLLLKSRALEGPKDCIKLTENESSSLKEWQNLVVQENGLLKLLDGKSEGSLCQIPEISKVPSLDNDNDLFIDNLFEETEQDKEKERKSSEEKDEIVLRLLRKYSKYSRDALDDDIVNAIDANDTRQEAAVRKRKMGYCPEKLYENFVDEKNEHVLRWLKDQQSQKLPTRRHSATEPTSSSAFESRKSSVTLPLSESRKSSVSSLLDGGKFSSRKNSITSVSSCSESEEGVSLTAQWQRILKKHLGGTKSLEKRLKKQREAWARNTRKLSTGSDGDLTSQP